MLLYATGNFRSPLAAAREYLLQDHALNGLCVYILLHNYPPARFFYFLKVRFLVVFLKVQKLWDSEAVCYVHKFCASKNTASSDMKHIQKKSAFELHITDSDCSFCTKKYDPREVDDFWWRRTDLNRGHCGYEPHALAT